MHTPILLAGLAALLFSRHEPASAQTSPAPPTAEWRVKDRFRLFDAASQGARDQVDAAMDRIAIDRDAPLAVHYGALLALLSDRDPSRAHTAELRRSHYQSAPGTPSRTSGRYDRDYLYPRHYQLELRVRGRGRASCRYASGLEVREGPCDQWIGIAVPAGDGIIRAAGARGEIGLTIDGRASSPVGYTFTDELIVALGDSFISGEGNPDRPSLIRADEPAAAFERSSWGATVDYGEALIRKAEWWDEPCHRSLLSWPVLSSLAYAAHDTQRAVTLVHLGCSGAVVDDMIRQGETDLPGGGDETDSQLALLDALMLRPSPEWRPRTVSTVLLSIGGNDIGFVGVLSTLALPPNGFTFGAAAARYVGKEALAVCPYIQSGKPLSRLCDTRLSAEARLKDLTPAYQRLGAALADRGIRPAQVHHALYANPLIGADGQPCDTRPAERRARTHGGFEALMGVLPKIGRGPRFSTWNFELHYLPETRISTLLYPARPGIGCDTSAEPDDSEVCQALLVHKWLNNAVATSGFVPITEHVGRIDGHGLCVVGNGPDLSLPLSEAGQWTGAKTPANYDPYVRADQGRWFRVPNDSILTQFDIENGVRRFHHGTAHPTFRAHIEYGEAALRQMLLAERAAP